MIKSNYTEIRKCIVMGWYVSTRSKYAFRAAGEPPVSLKLPKYITPITPIRYVNEIPDTAVHINILVRGDDGGYQPSKLISRKELEKNYVLVPFTTEKMYS